MKKKKILFEGTELSPLQRSNSSFRKHLAGIVFQKLFDFVSNGMFIFFYPTLYFGKIRERETRPTFDIIHQFFLPSV